MPRKVIHAQAEIDPMWPASRITMIGEDMIEKMQRQLPQGAIIVDTKMDVLNLPDRLAKQMRMSIYYDEPQSMPTRAPLHIDPNFFSGIWAKNLSTVA